MSSKPGSSSSQSSGEEKAPPDPHQDRDDRRSDLLAGSIADDEPVDWEGADDARSGRLRGYRALASVAEAFRSIRRGLGEDAGRAGEIESSDTGAPAAPGTWGHLEIRRVLGRGGFGTVYEAFDPSLRRNVALKLHRTSAVSDSTGERFLEEARRLARVRHPNVVTVHGAAIHDGRPGLWADFVEGKTLRQWIDDNGPMGPAEAVAVGADVCRALAAIHGAGLIHGDVKPSNVMREVGGRIVLMDFGAARDHDVETDEPVEGTPAVVAPEVLSGSRPTAASDLYSVGVLLYFLLTARFPLRAETYRSVRKAHDSGERFPLSDARPDLPRSLVGVVERAVHPDPDRRFRTAGEMERALSGVGGVATIARTTSHPRRNRLLWAAAGAALGAILPLLAFIWLNTGSSASQPIRFTLASGSLDWGAPLEANLAVHSGGRAWAFRADLGAGPRLYLQTLDSDEAREIAGTEDGRHPFWSPGGRFLGFTVGDTIRRVDPSTGASRTVTSIGNARFFGSPSWGVDDSILYAITGPEGAGVFRVAATGGTPEMVLEAADMPGFSFLGWPHHFPAGDRFLVVAGPGEDGPRLFVAALDGTPPVSVPEVGSRAVVVEPGILLFVRRGRLLAQRFDLEAARLRGQPAALVDGVSRRVRTGSAAFGASPALVVATRSEVLTRIQWYERNGTPGPRLGEPGDLRRPRISPRGDRVAVAMADAPGGVWDLWTFDIDRGLGTRITSTPWEEGTPVWSPDGNRIAFFSDEVGPPDLLIRPAHPGGEERALVRSGRVLTPRDWSPDGTRILYEHGFGQGADLWVAPVDGSEPFPWYEGPGEQTDGTYSPDGSWIAFSSTETGRSEIFVAPSDDADRRQRVSTGGGKYPTWSQGGEEIVFASDRALFRATFDRLAGEVVGRPDMLFKLEPPDVIVAVDTSPADDRFLLAIVDEERRRPTTAVRIGWRSALADP